MSDIISLGLWIKRRRKALDLTQAALAQRVGCSLDLIQKIEADARRPSREMAARLADMLELATDERAPFIQAARAELGADRLPPPAQSVAHGAFRGVSPAPANQPTPAATFAAPLPSGTVTFLFTDIEGSTRLWEEHLQAMPAVIERHNTLLHQVVSVHGGVVFKTVGDSILAVFADAPSALAAALVAQRVLLAEAWGAVGALRVRMALHTGSAEARDGDYLGPTINRAARLLDAGHGGQILITLATEQLVREHLPCNASLRDLGTQRLKDVSMPEQIFQLLAPDLPATFPALNTLDARRTNLPAPSTALIGRAHALAQIGALLHQSSARLVTLTGPGGIGKTRLAFQVAEALIDAFPDGVYAVDLAPIRAPSLVVSAVAQTLGIKETGGQPLASQLQQFLSDKWMLLLLDNFEHLLDAAPLLTNLLATTRHLKLLITSRERLHLRGEKEMAVPPLELPDLSNLPSLDQVAQYAAVQLFIQRAADAHPDFQITVANAAAVAEICARLDGLPLAIELAAARVKLFAPEALLARLHSRLALLTGGARDLPLRQQTIRNTIAWSYDLLTDVEQSLFQRLGVFVGGCTLAAVAAVCEGTTIRRNGDEAIAQTHAYAVLHDLRVTVSLLDGLAALVDKSLLRQVIGPDGDPRFGMLETIREYALEQLEANGEANELRQQHARYYLAWGEMGLPDQDAESLAQAVHLDHEFDNLRSALAWSQTTAGDPEIALQLTLVLASVWNLHGVTHERIAGLECSLNHPLGMARSALHYQVRMMLAEVLALTGNYAAARINYEQILSLARELSDTQKYAHALERLGWMAREQGDSGTAWLRMTESLAIFRDLGDTTAIASTLTTMAGIAILEEDPDQAELLLTESRALSQRVAPNTALIVWTLNHLGHVAQLRGDYGRAAQLHHESLTYMDSQFHASLMAAYHGLGETTLGQGQLDEATRWLTQGLVIGRKIGDQANMAWCLAGLGSAAAFDEEPERAARLWGAAEALRKAIGCRPAPAARTTYERALVMARAQLGEEAFAVAWAEGRALPLEQVIAEALVKPKAL